VRIGCKTLQIIFKIGYIAAVLGDAIPKDKHALVGKQGWGAARSASREREQEQENEKETAHGEKGSLRKGSATKIGHNKRKKCKRIVLDDGL